MITITNKLSIDNSLYEEISDDKSASTTGGAKIYDVKNFESNGFVNSFTTRTFNTKNNATDQIRIRVTKGNYRDMYVRAITPNGGKVSKSATFIDNSERRGKLWTIADNVLNYTKFKLRFTIPSKKKAIIAGRVSF